MNLDDFDLHSRLSKLEKQNRRMKQFGSVVLAVVAAIAIMGQAQAKKAIEANESSCGTAAGMCAPSCRWKCLRVRPWLSWFPATSLDR